MRQIVDKPWGQEIILAEANLPYSSKILLIKQGHRLSLQNHNQKTETLTLVSGQAAMVSGTNPQELKSQTMEPQTGYTILPGIIHRIEALTDCQIFESSTPEKGTTYRLEDDYHRPDETK